MKIPEELRANTIPGLNTYLHGKSEWNERYGNLVCQRFIAILIVVLSLIITLFTIVSYVNLSNQVKFVPYVVEIDKLGKPLAVYKA